MKSEQSHALELFFEEEELFADRSMSQSAGMHHPQFVLL